MPTNHFPAKAIKALKTLYDNATPGEWHLGVSEHSGRPILRNDAGERICGVYGNTIQRKFLNEDAAFIAGAHTAVPDLVREVERLRGLLRRLKPYVEVVNDMTGDMVPGKHVYSAELEALIAGREYTRDPEDE